MEQAKACYYEPEINPLYDDLSLHYDFVVMPTRVSKPRDKAKVENAVQQVQRWVIAPLRGRQFFSLQEINEAMRPLLEELNGRKMRHIGKSRKELFEEIERPVLKALPEYTFEVSDRKRQKVGPNYHISYERHYYSVPYIMIGQTVEIRATQRTVEVYHEGQRVASHLRDDTPGGYSTVASHMPQSHQRVKQALSNEEILRQAQRIGPSVAELLEGILQKRKHSEQAYRSCIGVLRLARRYEAEKVEAACRVALDYELLSYTHVKNILQNKMFLIQEDNTEDKAVPEHKNLRGSGYYN